MNDTELQAFKREVISTIKNETHDAIKETGQTWVIETVTKTVPVAIEATFIKLGLDCTRPLDAQKDFAFLRQTRSESEDRKKIVVQTLTKYLTTFCISACTAGLAVWAIVKP